MGVIKSASVTFLSEHSQIVGTLGAPCSESFLMIYDSTNLIIRLSTHGKFILKNFILGAKPCLAKNVFDNHKDLFFNVLNIRIV